MNDMCNKCMLSLNDFDEGALDKVLFEVKVSNPSTIPQIPKVTPGAPIVEPNTQQVVKPKHAEVLRAKKLPETDAADIGGLISLMDGSVAPETPDADNHDDTVDFSDR